MDKKIQFAIYASVAAVALTTGLVVATLRNREPDNQIETTIPSSAQETTEAQETAIETETEPSETAGEPESVETELSDQDKAQIESAFPGIYDETIDPSSFAEDCDVSEDTPVNDIPPQTYSPEEWEALQTLIGETKAEQKPLQTLTIHMSEDLDTVEDHGPIHIILNRDGTGKETADLTYDTGYSASFSFPVGNYSLGLAKAEDGTEFWALPKHIVLSEESPGEYVLVDYAPYAEREEKHNNDMYVPGWLADANIVYKFLYDTDEMKDQVLEVYIEKDGKYQMYQKISENDDFIGGVLASPGTYKLHFRMKLDKDHDYVLTPDTAEVTITEDNIAEQQVIACNIKLEGERWYYSIREWDEEYTAWERENNFRWTYNITNDVMFGEDEVNAGDSDSADGVQIERVDQPVDVEEDSGEAINP